MAHLNALNPEITTGKSKDLFNSIQSKLGMVPNMMRTMGNSPAVLNSYLLFSSALGEGVLGGKIGELIALNVANANNCEYCNAAHSFIGEKLLHIDLKLLDDARKGKSSDAKIESVLLFARALVEKKGKVSDEDIAAIKNAGFDDAEIAEIIAHVGLNIFTNYFNIAARTVIDFPEVKFEETSVI